MSIVTLPLCSVPKLAMRDGYAGPTAHIILPFYSYGYWFASGQEYTFPQATIAQDKSALLVGQRKPNTFQKDCCSCLPG